jgi:hypothetical protein
MWNAFQITIYSLLLFQANQSIHFLILPISLDLVHRFKEEALLRVFHTPENDLSCFMVSLHKVIDRII